MLESIQELAPRNVHGENTASFILLNSNKKCAVSLIYEYNWWTATQHYVIFGTDVLESWNLAPHARAECMGKTSGNIPFSYFTPLQNFCLDYQFKEYSNFSDD